MGTRHHGNVLLGDVDADGEALLVDVGEVLLGLLGVFVRDVKAHVVEAVNFHFLVDGACHDVARGERQALVILLHELLAVRQSQYAAVAAHGLGYEVGGVLFAWVVERGGVELYELHALYGSLGAVSHGYAVAGGNLGVGGGGIHGSATAGAEHGDT